MAFEKIKNGINNLKHNKKHKNTLIMFSALFAVFTSMSILFGVSLPKKNNIISVENKDVEGITWKRDGSSYFIYSDDVINYNLIEKDKTLQSIQFRDEINTMLSNDNKTCIAGSLNKFTISYFEGDTSEYLLVSDNMANLFKYKEENGQYVLTNDYYLREFESAYKLIGTQKGDEQYFITSVRNQTMVEGFDLANISTGPIGKKYVWDNSNKGNGSQVISHIKTDSKYWNIFHSGDDIYLTQAFGVFKINKSFSDYGDFSFLETMYSEYPTLYVNQLKEDLQAANPTVYTDEKLAKMTQGDLERVYFDVTGNSKSYAENKAKDAFKTTNSWCLDLDYKLGNITVKDDYIDKTKYSIIRTGPQTNAAKIVNYANNNSIIIASVYDDSLYEADISELSKVGILDNKTLDDFATKINISFSGKKFAQYNPLSINDCSNVAYVSFLSDDTIAIIDLSEKGNYKVLYSFQANFDVLYFFGNSNNTSLYYMVYDTKVSLDNHTSTYRSIYSINPSKTRYQGFFKISMIVSMAFAFVSLIVAIISLVSGTNEKRKDKLVALGADLKKHKFVYIALIPFIVLLILFCYYEAIGSISLSFFSYTRANPTMKWNNFANYIEIFNSNNFLLSVGNMLFFLVGDLILAIIPPTIFAFFLSVMNSKRYSKFIRSLLLIPGIIPGIAGLLIWRTGIFGEYGVLNAIVKLFNGQPVEWLANSDISRWSLLLMGFPFVGGYLIIYGGMMNIPKDFYEEGELSGINIWQRFTKIDVPLVMPQLKYIFIMNFIASVQNYSRTYMLKSSGTVTLAENMYLAMTSIDSNYGLAAAYATLIFIFLFAAVAANFRQQKKNYLGDN